MLPGLLGYSSQLRFTGGSGQSLGASKFRFKRQLQISRFPHLGFVFLQSEIEVSDGFGAFSRIAC